MVLLWLTLCCEISPYDNNRAASLKEVPQTDKSSTRGALFEYGVVKMGCYGNACQPEKSSVEAGRERTGKERSRERERLCVLASFMSQRKWKEGLQVWFSCTAHADRKRCEWVSTPNGSTNI